MNQRPPGRLPAMILAAVVLALPAACQSEPPPAAPTQEYAERIASYREDREDAPVVANTVTLDFNMAYNPPCAFTPYATCPLPPSGNTIGAPIEAGERGYRLGHHK